MISYSITVAFCWDGITGEGVVDPGELCHGDRVNEDDEIKILIKKVHPADSFHPINGRPLELGTWTVIQHLIISCYDKC